MRCDVLLISLLIFSFLFGAAAVGQVPHHMHSGYSHADDLMPDHVTDVINTPEFIDRAMEETRRRNPELYQRALERIAAPFETVAYEIGDEENFYILKFVDRTGGTYTAGWFDEVPFRLMAIGENSFIWVSIGELENEHVTQAEVDAILHSLEEQTPPRSRDPNKGIFELVNEYFGNPPNYGPTGIGSGEGKTSVLLTDIRDGWDPDGGGGFIAGFFFSLDQSTNQFSNRRDIIYIDTYPGIFNPIRGEPDPARPLSTLAHEYQHLVFHNYRGTTTDETWLNEGLSEFSEAFCGFSLRSPSRYFSNTNRSMTRWGDSTTEDVFQDYSRVALWTMYLWEQLGDDYIRHLVQLPVSPYGRGISIVNAAAQQVGSDLRFPDLFTDFNLANYIKNINVDSRYGYIYDFNGRPHPRQSHNDPNASRTGIQIQGYASYFIDYSFGDSLQIRFSSSADIKIKAIEVGQNIVNVVPVQPGQTYVQNDYGETFRTIMFVVVNTASTTASFNYESSGGLRYFVDEYKFDDGTPKPFTNSGATFLGFPNSDEYIGSGWAVQFTPQFPENQLLTARIYAAFAQEFTGSTVPQDAPKQFYFHIWGDNNGSPGNNLIEPFLFETTRANFPGAFIDIDLYDYAGQLNDLQGPIYIGFTHSTEYAVNVGMTNQMNQNRTFAFFGPNHQNNPNQWAKMFDLSVGQPPNQISLNGWNMMMRAIFAVYDPDRITEEIPIRYVLEQNYPNPFNQETRILYGVPRDSEVKIEIYDILGRKVKTLVDEFKAEGSHNVVWNATDDRGRVVSSGIYYYRLTGGDAVITNKMIFLR